MKRAVHQAIVKKSVVFGCLLLLCQCLASCRRVTSLQQAREATLKNDLFVMRQAIDKFTLDTQKPPQSLQDLVDAHYLPRIPTDPFTNKKDWVAEIDDVPLTSGHKLRGLTDVHSHSSQTAKDGTALNTWLAQRDTTRIQLAPYVSK